MIKNKIKILYDEKMVKENGGFSPSSYKGKEVVNDWLKLFDEKIEIVSFNSLKKEDFYLIHDKNYVDDIFSGKIKNGFGQKRADFEDVFCLTNSSLYEASKIALKEKVAVSPSSGFHHARYDKAEGFCTFNGLILTSVKLKEERLVNKVGILDFDMHYGNGTDEIIKKLKIDYIHHYTAGKKYDLNFKFLEVFKSLIKYFYNQRGVNKKPKLRQKLLKGKGKLFINEINKILEGFKDCDLIIYQAGADQHIDDPYGGLLTYDEMRERDKKVFNFCKKNSIPIVWNLAGGYQKDEKGSIEPVLRCHRQTMEECLKVYDISE
jgi:acetoin utilization deacetylase AcuC-like enzyme